MTGKSKDKEKETKKGSKGANYRGPFGGGGGDDVDTSAADLLAVLADQVVKEEKKKLKPGIKSRKKGKGAKKKISKCAFIPSSYIIG